MKTTVYYNSDDKVVFYWQSCEYFVITITGISTIIIRGYVDANASLE